MYLLIHLKQKRIQISNINSQKRDPPQKRITNMSTIKIGSSCGSNTMKIKREIHQATSTNPQSRGGLLSSHHGGADLDLGGVGDLSSGASTGEISYPSKIKIIITMMRREQSTSGLWVCGSSLMYLSLDLHCIRST